MKLVYNYLSNPRKDPKTGKFEIDTFIDFSYEQEVPLLGRNGFFNYFKNVIFKEKDKVVELEKD